MQYYPNNIIGHQHIMDLLKIQYIEAREQAISSYANALLCCSQGKAML